MSQEREAQRRDDPADTASRCFKYQQKTDDPNPKIKRGLGTCTVVETGRFGEGT